MFHYSIPVSGYKEEEEEEAATHGTISCTSPKLSAVELTQTNCIIHCFPITGAGSSCINPCVILRSFGPLKKKKLVPVLIQSSAYIYFRFMPNLVHIQCSLNPNPSPTLVQF